MDPRVALASAYLTLNLPFGPNSPPPSLDFGIQPALHMADPVVGEDYGRVAGLSTPIGYSYSSGANDRVHAEEQLHMRQMEALGPAFWLAYGLTGGEPFEPYNQRVGNYPDPNTQGYLERMWTPDEGQERQFPQARLTFGEDPTLQILPGYEEALRALWGLISDAE